MKFLSLRIRLTILLLLICTLLGGLLAHLWRTPMQSAVRQSSQTIVNENSQPQSDMVTYTPPTIAAFGGILERPLFTLGREPPPEPEKLEAPVKIVTPLNLQLEGVAINPDTRIAVVRDLNSNELLRIAEGEKHQGWLVERVHPTGAAFSQGEETRELTLIPEDNAQIRR